MDNKIDSSRSQSHKSHDKRGRTTCKKITDRIHHHSPRHSTRRACNSSSLVKKPKKGTRVDELQGEMNKIKSHTFYGKQKKDEDA